MASLEHDRNKTFSCKWFQLFLKRGCDRLIPHEIKVSRGIKHMYLLTGNHGCNNLVRNDIMFVKIRKLHLWYSAKLLLAGYLILGSERGTPLTTIY